MPNSTLLGLPLLESQQAQKHVTHNEALLGIDALTHLAVIARSLSAPPATPSEGDRYLIAPAPTGDWTGHAGHIAYRAGGVWRFAVPRSGWRVWVAAESLFIVFNGMAWTPVGGAGLVDGDKGDVGVQGTAWTAKATARAGHRLLSKLRANETSAAILILGDSTGYDTCEPGSAAIFNPAQCFPRLAAQALAVAYPAYTIIHKTAGAQMPTPPITGYGAGNGGDGATATVQTGTGAYTLTLLDGSVPGTTPAWPLASRWKAMAESAEPDLVILNYGHNDTDADRFDFAYRALIEDLRQSWDGVPILCLAQNWGTNGPSAKLKNRLRVHAIAAERRCGLFDYGELIEMNGGNTSTALAGDGTHLSIAGQIVLANALVAREFTWNDRWTPIASPSSSLLNAGPELLNDPFFLRPIDATFKRGGWYVSAANLTASRSTLQSDFIAAGDTAAASTALKLDGNGVAGEQELRQFIDVPSSYWGKYVTLTARVYRPSAAASANRGNLLISDSGGQSAVQQWPSYGASVGANAGTDGWATIQTTRQIAAGTAYLIARIYVAPSNAAPTSQMFVQWASMRLGRSPSRPAFLTREVAEIASRKRMTLHVAVNAGSYQMSGDDQMLRLQPAAAIAVFTLNLPTAPQDGQEFTVTTTQDIAALSVVATGGLILGNAMPASLVNGAAFRVYFNGAGSRWYAVQSSNAFAQNIWGRALAAPLINI
jgi:lysophospholipase L1-like esterase